jgi:hypothetical protein
VKVLLDENLDHALRTLLGRHEVVTAAYMGWGGLNNGELLLVAEDNGIQVLLTGDQTLNHEHVWLLWRYPLFSYRSSRTTFRQLLPRSTTPRPVPFRLSTAACSAGRNHPFEKPSGFRIERRRYLSRGLSAANLIR